LESSRSGRAVRRDTACSFVLIFLCEVISREGFNVDVFFGIDTKIFYRVFLFLNGVDGA